MAKHRGQARTASPSAARRSFDKRISQLVTVALDQGCELERRNRHYALRFPDGQTVTIPTTSEGRTGMNFRQELRRRGINVPR